MNLEETFHSWKPSCMMDFDPERAKLIVASLRYRRELLKIDPWLPFPQAVTAFMFGRNAKNLPVGALFLLWDRGEPFVSVCPACGGSLYSFGFGWSFFNSAMTAVCIGCTKRFYRQVVKNIYELQGILSEPLIGSAFYIRHMEIYGVFAGQRRLLWQTLKMLGAQDLPSQEWAISFETSTIVSKNDPEGGYVTKTFLEITPRKPIADPDQKTEQG